MARRVISGIYMITNKLNGKVYIGQSKDILKRFRQYYWGVTSNSDYSETTHNITTVIRELGFENFEFSIIASGPEYIDVRTRMTAEMQYIAKYKANDPEFGYNEDIGGDPGSLLPRTQSVRERAKRAIPVFLYNIETQSVLLYLFGARAVADDFKCDKAITSHAMNRLDVFADKYYIIPARYNDRHRLYEKKLASFEEVHSNPKFPNRTINKIANKRKRLEKAIKYIDKVAPEFGYSNMI
ncbi:GIY-YIG nuclease family protein [uncultured Duncaniella sp.]|uniref:GIY-YIG nuclease family protein n=1 Tax=uncultured Duncaniella sp. TaxID=2768039 RepID=UPI00262BA977|nr:GIY-YIG nuclease family protein [uncultured Duncaniella sp.]